MFGIPAPTDYDVKFRLLGIPVRVSPWFWVVTALLGWQSNDAIGVVIWIGCVFVSILVHEFGHGLTARRLVRQQPAVILHGMGGLCVYDREHRSPWGRVAVLAMGPGAGFLFAGVIALVGAVLFGVVPAYRPPMGVGFRPINPEKFIRLAQNPRVFEIYFQLLFINIVWGLFNLLPIFPLDGGQLAASFLSMHDRREGQRRAFIVSFVTAALLAIWSYQKGSTYNAFFLGYLALMNFQFLQAATAQRKYGDFADDEQWWRR